MRDRGQLVAGLVRTVAALTVSTVSAAVTVDPTVLTDAERARARALEPAAAAVLDAFANYNARLSPDGEWVLYLSDRTGVAQAFVARADRPDGEARRLTDGVDGVHWATFSRDGTQVLFTRDVGHDESYRIYRIDLATGSETDLTPNGELHRDNPLLPAARPKLMVFSARSRTSPATRLIVQDIHSGVGRTAYEDAGPCRATDVTGDGGHALLLRIGSRSDRVLLEVDLGTGSARRLYPAEGSTASISDARFGADGRVLVATDEGGDTSAVLALDRTTASVVRRSIIDQPRGALAGSLEVAPGGSPVAVLVNAGNRSEVRILDGRTLDLRCVLQQPLGLAELGTFRSDGSELALVIASPNLPWDVFAGDATSGEIRPLRREPRPGLERLGAIATRLDSVAGFDGLDIPVHTYLPDPSATVAAVIRRPTIVFFHGGPAWSSQVGWHPLARFFVGQGYAWVEPNVRGSLGFGRTYELADNREKRWNVLRDMESVNRWVKGQPWCDPERVVIMGLSYGGYLTLMGLVHQPELWRVGVDLFGVADLRTLLASTDATVRTALTAEFGGLDGDAELLAALSPLGQVDRLAAPLFVYAGQNDPRVPRAESDAIVAAARHRGVPVEYMVAADEGHSFARRTTQIELFARVARFLADALAQPPREGE